MRNKEEDSAIDLSNVLRLLALVAVKDMKLKEQVALMSRAGFDRKEMAQLLGTTPNSISVRLNELRKVATKKRLSGKK